MTVISSNFPKFWNINLWLVNVPSRLLKIKMAIQWQTGFTSENFVRSTFYSLENHLFAAAVKRSVTTLIWRTEHPNKLYFLKCGVNNVISCATHIFNDLQKHEVGFSSQTFLVTACCAVCSHSFHGFLSAFIWLTHTFISCVRDSPDMYIKQLKNNWTKPLLTTNDI